MVSRRKTTSAQKREEKIKRVRMKDIGKQKKEMKARIEIMHWIILRGAKAAKSRKDKKKMNIYEIVPK